MIAPGLRLAGLLVQGDGMPAAACSGLPERYRGEGSRISNAVLPGSLVTFTHPPYWLTSA